MHAIVSGAGVAGLALAGRLALDGWTVEIVERAPGPRASGYLIDFFGPGYDAAERLGLLPRLRSRAEHFDELRSVDASGRVRGRLPIALVEQAVAGRYMTILRPQIVAALAEAVPDGVRMRWGTQVEAVHDDGAHVQVLLSDGDRVEADLLVGADGVGSRVRQLVWGTAGGFVRPVGDLLAVAWIGDDAALNADLEGKVAMQLELDRQLVVAPLGEEGVTGFAVLRGVGAADARRAVAELGVLGRRAVRAVRDPYIDEVAQTVVAPWVRGRTVLLGDACAAVSLLAGQGASLAIAGAERLAEELAFARHPSDVTAGLAAFERDWRPIVEREQARGRRAQATFAPHTRLELEAQRAIWKAAAMPGVAQLVAKAAGGVTKAR
ncbi:2-polyprenyl-6-methoxyphenol hydroxylase [Agrococcus baldri]|uniref:2-polyprenyl-6-methoxyphenol hydroxylase n=1 Tax=Agrococcus baldri TaxID=153730 RepID=A0AA94HMX2_9MICO|nr:FAD-dependent monooxygenase [Agrococcus baldri]SFS13987.1 2-polyprenyl-6-methoxyphenol hydroxylase [Agrococcus baldri]